MRSAAFFATISVLACLFFSTARAADDNCRLVRSEGVGFLRQCGTKLYSFSLSFNDIGRHVENDLHGRFTFDCRFSPAMCEDVGTISGFFFPPAYWKNSSMDAQAIFDVSQQMAYGAVSWSGSSKPPPAPVPVCPIVDMSIADMPGKVTCYDHTDMKGGTVVIVASDDRVGLILTFSQRDRGPSELRDKVMSVLSRFSVDRAEGDAGLMRWMR